MRPTWAALSYLQDVMYGILGSILGDFWGHLYNVAQINPCGRVGESGNRRQASAPRACWGHTWGPCSWDHPTLEAFWDLPSSPPHPPCLGRAQQPCLYGVWDVGSLYLGPVQPAEQGQRVSENACQGCSEGQLCLGGSERSATCALLPGGSHWSAPWPHPHPCCQTQKKPPCAEYL